MLNLFRAASGLLVFLQLAVAPKLPARPSTVVPVRYQRAAGFLEVGLIVAVAVVVFLAVREPIVNAVNGLIGRVENCTSGSSAVTGTSGTC